MDAAFDPESAHAVIRPDAIPFISYPYEWCFGQLKAAALRTLEIQQLANAAGFTLRDASAYNIQFVGTNPVLIDSLSFAPLRSRRPVGRLPPVLRALPGAAGPDGLPGCPAGDAPAPFVNGLPLDLASRLLPRRTLLGSGSSRTSISMPGPSVASGRMVPLQETVATDSIGDTARAALLDSLMRVVRGLRWQPRGTEWADYAENTSYGSRARPPRTISSGTSSPAAKTAWSGTWARTPGGSAGLPPISAIR